jgi:hypothetical protein
MAHELLRAWQAIYRGRRGEFLIRICLAINVGRCSSSNPPLQSRYGISHRKFAASLVLPTPRYFGTRGYEHIGRVMST